jgi:hypothetical protein
MNYYIIYFFSMNKSFHPPTIKLHSRKQNWNTIPTGKQYLRPEYKPNPNNQPATSKGAENKKDQPTNQPRPKSQQNKTKHSNTGHQLQISNSTTQTKQNTLQQIMQISSRNKEQTISEVLEMPFSHEPKFVCSFLF